MLTSLGNVFTPNNNRLEAFRVNGKAPRYCYLIAGTHGDEPESVYVQQMLLNELVQKSEFHLPLIVIPELNPDGLILGTRGNANGVDLNRNLPASNWSPQAEQPRYFSGPEPLSEIENQFLLSLFDQCPPGFILSFHSWKPMLNSNGECEEVLHHLNQRNGYPIVRETIDDHPTPGSLGSFVSEKLGVPILTFECPTISQRSDMESIWQENRSGLISLMLSELLLPFLEPTANELEKK